MSRTAAPNRKQMTPRRQSRIRIGSTTTVAAWSLSFATLLLSGCTTPSAANIALRKQVQTQQAEIDQLKREHAADAASRRSVASTGPAATGPSLNVDQAAGVFTTHGIRLGKLTGTDDKGLVVHLIPTDDAGDDFKAAGEITVEAFDLSASGKRIGAWSFNTAEAKQLWNGTALRYEYVVPCPWQEKPSQPQVTVKVTFVDALTGRSFETQQVVRAE